MRFVFFFWLNELYITFFYRVISCHILHHILIIQDDFDKILTQ